MTMEISNQKLNTLRTKAKLEVGEVEDMIPKSIAQVKEIISAENKKIILHPPIYDEIYLRCLRTAKYDVNRAAKLYINFCKLRHKGIHGLREISIPSLQEIVFQTKLISMLASRDSYGRKIILFRLNKWDPTQIRIESIFASLFLLLDEALTSIDTQLQGFVILADCTGFGVSHARQVRISHLEAFFKTVQNSYPARFKEIHILNNHSIVNVLLAAAKPFMKDKIRNRLFCYGNDLESFLKSVDPNILPECAGGRLSDAEYDDKNLVRNLMQKDDYYKDFLQFGYPER